MLVDTSKILDYNVQIVEFFYVLIIGVLHLFIWISYVDTWKLNATKTIVQEICGQRTHVLRIIAVCRLLTILHLRIENYELHWEFDVLNSRLVTKFALIAGAWYSCENYN